MKKGKDLHDGTIPTKMTVVLHWIRITIKTPLHSIPGTRRSAPLKAIKRYSFKMGGWGVFKGADPRVPGMECKGVLLVFSNTGMNILAEYWHH